MKLYFYADESNPSAKSAKETLKKKYAPFVTSLKEADTIISLGGDGTTLAALRLGLKHGKKVYGMNLGHLGAYQNTYSSDGLIQRLQQATSITLHPLTVRAINTRNTIITQIAWNEIYVRSGDNPQQARLIGTIDGDKRPFYVCGDGHLVASPMGSTAYNLSAGGHKIGFREKLLANTSIASCRGVRDLLPATTHIHLEVLQSDKRSVSLFTDNVFLGKIRSCDIFQDSSIGVPLLWDKQKIKAFEQISAKIIAKRPKTIQSSLILKGYYYRQYQRT